MADKHILAIDQGTTSTRAIIFDHSGRPVASGQREHAQILPAPGFVEHDPTEIWANVRHVIGEALSKAEMTRHDIAAVGITNQRETTIIWDRRTGEPVHNAIVWQDTRTQDYVDRLRAAGVEELSQPVTGLPLSPYFSATKIMWLLDNVEGARERAETGELAFGTPDTFVAWHLTGQHITDVTNASRTNLMSLTSCQWDDEILAALRIPRALLPTIVSSSAEYEQINPNSLLREVPLSGILGDQQAAAFGQAAFEPGIAKNTYGTGCFVIVNTGSEAVRSGNGLLTTVAYRLGDDAPSYALEGSIAVTGSLIQWLRDNLGIISSAPEVEELARSVPDNGGCYFVPAFSGLFAPRWRPDARGVWAGLTRFINKGHLARAALEATAFQTREVLDAMAADVGAPVSDLRVDGGMTANDLLMQFQADILGIPVIRPAVPETTALGAAYAAGLAVGYWDSLDNVRENWAEDRRWTPTMGEAERASQYANWAKAVSKAVGWTG